MTVPPFDLPRLIHYCHRDGNQSYALPWRMSHSCCLPKDAVFWKAFPGFRTDPDTGLLVPLPGGGWRPVADLPAGWLPWLTREAVCDFYATNLSEWEVMRGQAVARFWTFRQLLYFYREKHGRWPDPLWPGMPLDPMHNYRKVRDVPPEELVPEVQPCTSAPSTDATSPSPTSPSPARPTG